MRALSEKIASITVKYSDSEVYIVTALPACEQQAADEGRKQGTYHKTELWYRKLRFNILLILFLYTSYFSAHILKYIPEDRMKNLMALMATPITSKTQQHRDIFNAQSLLWPRFFVSDFVFLALYAFVYIKCILVLYVSYSFNYILDIFCQDRSDGLKAMFQSLI